MSHLGWHMGRNINSGARCRKVLYIVSDASTRLLRNFKNSQKSREYRHRKVTIITWNQWLDRVRICKIRIHCSLPSWIWFVSCLGLLAGRHNRDLSESNHEVWTTVSHDFQSGKAWQGGIAPSLPAGGIPPRRVGGPGAALRPRLDGRRHFASGY